MFGKLVIGGSRVDEDLVREVVEKREVLEVGLIGFVGGWLWRREWSRGV